MTRGEMLNEADNMDKKSRNYYLKYLGWLFLAGAAIGKAAQSFALSSNHKLIGTALRKEANETNEEN